MQDAGGGSGGGVRGVPLRIVDSGVVDAGLIPAEAGGRAAARARMSPPVLVGTMLLPSEKPLTSRKWGVSL